MSPQAMTSSQLSYMNRKCPPQAAIFCEHTHTYILTLTQDRLWPGKGVFIQVHYTDAPYVPGLVLGTEPWQWPGGIWMMAWTCWVSTGNAGFCQGRWGDSSEGLTAELSPEEQVWWMHWRTDPLQQCWSHFMIWWSGHCSQSPQKTHNAATFYRDQSKQSGWNPGGFAGNVSV